MGQRHRVKISATLDPELVAGVDAYVRNHPETNRGKVIDDALMLWLAEEQRRAMIEQFSEDDRPEHERAQWRRVQAEAARRIFGRDRE
jgi:hypothetical protein